MPLNLSLLSSPLFIVYFIDIGPCADNKDKIIGILNDQLRLKAHQRSAEVAAINDKIDKLNLAQNNLLDNLEKGLATDTLMNKLQKNETELAALTAQLEAKTDEISIIDDDTYNKLVNRFVDYMGNHKTPQAVDLRNAAIDHIDYSSDKTTVHFNRGVSINKETREYFDNEKNWEVSS